MFDQVEYAEWTRILPIVGFGITALAFLYFCVRAIRMKKKDVEHMSHLPLEDDASGKPRSKTLSNPGSKPDSSGDTHSLHNSRTP